MGLVRITSLSPVSMDLRTRRPAGWHAKNDRCVLQRTVWLGKKKEG